MRSLEARLLSTAEGSIGILANSLGPEKRSHEAILTALEIVSAVYARREVNDYWARFGGAVEVSPFHLEQAARVLADIQAAGIPVPLALASLAREPIDKTEQRKTGAYYTDWRLAQYLASQSVSKAPAEGLWIDPACGTGILLVAAALEVPVGVERDELIRHRLCGSDLSQGALRGVLLSVASLTGDLDALAEFKSRLFQQDSLRSGSKWAEIVQGGAALVIGNPPWERLRVTRHEAALEKGIRSNYGETISTVHDLGGKRAELREYAGSVALTTLLQGKGEHDLYKLFLELSLSISSDDGVVALLLPAGLIRSQNTEKLRREVLSISELTTIAVIENRARHFAIDTRFKFIALTAKKGSCEQKQIELFVADRSGNLPSRPVRITLEDLQRTRADLSIPEVRSSGEWELYAKLSCRGKELGHPDSRWQPIFSREVDMTLNRSVFRSGPAEGRMPLIEGRHVNQYRWRAKSYVSGQGRSAVWNAQSLAEDSLNAQWYVATEDLKTNSLNRSKRARVGFCDITGQTNERSLMVARIPAGVVCGNKVPTIDFGDDSELIEESFIAVTNSFCVDWLLRRVVTTTVNFFILKSLALPVISHTSIKKLAKLARTAASAEGNPNSSLMELGETRARIDALVAFEWGVSLHEMRLVLDDFPLIDRGQPSIQGEPTSTITRDSVLLALAELYDNSDEELSARVAEARQIGAIPYVPAEYVREKVR